MHLGLPSVVCRDGGRVEASRFGREDKQMSRWKSKFYTGALCGAMVLALLAGGGTRHEALAQAEKPGFFEGKAIAEAGFIYGLPIVMNYAVLYEYVIDRNSGQWKMP